MFLEYLSLMPTFDAKLVLIAACGIFTAQVEQAVSLAKEMRAKLQETGSKTSGENRMGKTGQTCHDRYAMKKKAKVLLQGIFCISLGD